MNDIRSMTVRHTLSRMKYVVEENIENAYNEAIDELDNSVAAVRANSRSMSVRR